MSEFTDALNDLVKAVRSEERYPSELHEARACCVALYEAKDREASWNGDVTAAAVAENEALTARLAAVEADAEALRDAMRRTRESWRGNAGGCAWAVNQVFKDIEDRAVRAGTGKTK